jgi:endonuclease/exonuclease/phosphatase family metal-dependent hydrolase
MRSVSDSLHTPPDTGVFWAMTALLRRAPLLALLLVTACGEGTGVIDEGLDGTGETTSMLGPPGHVRIAAGNISSGAKQSYDPGNGLRILKAVQPDVALLQEFNFGDNSPTALRSFVDQALGTDYTYVRGNTGEQIPNGILTRYPVRQSGTWVDPTVNGTRGFTWALIDVPGEVDLFAVSVHLSTTNATNRQTEAAALVAQLEAAVPAGAYVVLGGDFNTGSRTEPALTTLGQVFTVTGPWPVDQQGNGNTSATRSKPYDWVLASPALDARHVDTTLGAEVFPAGAVIDTRVFSPISDLSPALPDDSAAVAMQHMAVVRDFLLDVAPPPPPKPLPTAGRVLINEVLANEPGTSAAGEFVELVNAGDQAVDLSGWTLSDSVAVRHTFAANTTLAGHGSLVVWGGLAGVKAGVNAVVASTGTLSLSNVGDAVKLASGSTVVDQLTYGAGLAAVDGVSMTRAADLDATAPFVLHTAKSAALASPGTRFDGSAF